MKITGATRLAGVAGWPVAHSLSPLLMNAWIAASGLDAAYGAYPVRPETGLAALKAIGALGLSGLNITTPLKEMALKAADIASPTARAIGAANLLTARDGYLHAYNTDAPGFLEACQEADIDVTAGPALVIGAGGAARAIVHALVSAHAPRLIIVNRTRDRAQALAADLASDAWTPRWEDRHLALEEAALVVNATSLGLNGVGDPELDWRRARRRAAAIDAVYRPLRTPFLAAAAAAGLKTADGLGMLIGQARPAFEALFDAPPPESLDARGLLEAALRRS